MTNFFENKIKDNNKAKFFCSFLLCLLIYCILFVAHDFVFCSNDDKMMFEMSYGKYTHEASSEIIFMSHLISAPIAWLSGLMPTVPVYGIIFTISNFIAVVIIAYAMISQSKTLFSFIISLISFIIFFVSGFYYSVVNSQFTINAGIYACALIALIFIYKRDFSIMQKILFYLSFCFLCYMSVAVRYKVFILAFPFLVLFVLFRAIPKRIRWKTAVLLCAIPIGFYALNSGIDCLARNNKEYSEYQKYNIVRSDLYDYYGFPDYEDNKAIYDELGITKDEYELISNYFIYIDEANYDNLVKLRDYQVNNIKSNILSRFIVSMQSIVESMINPINLTLVISMIILLILNTIVSIKHRKILKLLVGLFVVLGMGVVSLFTAITMKFPWYICLVLLLFVNIGLYMMVLNDISNFSFKEKSKLRYTAIVIMSIFVLSLIYPCFTTIKNNNLIVKNIDTYIEIQEELNDIDGLYIYDVESSAKFNTKLFSQITYEENCIKVGGWYEKSPWQQDLIKSHGYSSATDILQNEEKLYFVSNNEARAELLSNYLIEKYSRKLTLEKEIVENYKLYKVINI